MSQPANVPSPRDVIKQYVAWGFKPVFWDEDGDAKGPREQGWTQRAASGLYVPEEYKDGQRVGLLTGVEYEPGKHLTDVDVDWAEGYRLAVAMLPATGLVYGRESKPVSHCMYGLALAIASMRFECPVSKRVLLEVRGTKSDGTLGMQSMSPPSRHSKDGKYEVLEFRHYAPVHFYAEMDAWWRRVRLAATNMLLGMHLGMNGFGHEPRLAWAGFMLRLGVTIDECVEMGAALSVHCNNVEVHDVRTVVESTANNLARDGKKVKGGPALARLIGKDGQLVVNRIMEWLGSDQDFARDDKGRPLPKNQNNIRRSLRLLNADLTYNEFSAKYILNGQPLEDDASTMLYLTIDREHHYQPPTEFYKMVLVDVARQHSFHPVKQYLDGLRWDGRSRIDEWLITSCGAEDTPYVRAVGSLMLIAGVRRIRHPGCKHDEALILEGKQGRGKSTTIAALCPDPDWFTDGLKLHFETRELIEATLGKWIVEAAELTGARKAEQEALKAMLSRQVDGPVRMAYGHFPIERPRHFIIIGSTNSTEYMGDPSGGRRFWPVMTTDFNTAWVIANRDQLWAEACVREASGESSRLPEHLWPDATAQQELRHEVDPWEQQILDAVSAIAPSGDERIRVIRDELFEVLNVRVEFRDRLAAKRVTDIMTRLNFSRIILRDEQGKPVRGFIQDRKGPVGFPQAPREPGDDDDDNDRVVRGKFGPKDGL